MHELYNEALVKRVKSELAKEIHDELGNALAVISSRIKVAKLKLQKNDELQPDFFDKTELVVDQLLTSTKDFIWAVGSASENPTETFYYLRDLAAGLFEGSEIEFEAELNDQCSENLKLDIKESYQVILLFKEAFTNIIKHSNATKVTLAYTVEDHLLTVELIDNGVGFDPQVKSIKGTRSLGLKNMNYRADKVGGTVGITTKPGFGTKVGFSLIPSKVHIVATGQKTFTPRQAS